MDLLTDFPERFAPGARLYLRGDSVTVERSRPAGDGGRLVVKLREVGDRTRAEDLRGITLDILEDDLAVLPEGQYYRFQLLGLQVWTDDGRPLGVVVEIVETGVNDVFVVRDEGGSEVLVPNRPDIVEIDTGVKRLTVHVIPGLLPEEGRENDGPPRSRRRRR